MSQTPVEFIYVHDPMCSWCWGHRATWDRLEAELRTRMPVRYCVGGLAADSDIPMPEETKGYVMANWQRVTEVTGAGFNYDFWQRNSPRRSTYPACRAAIAARWQGAERAMISALQEAYYQRALNPSDLSTHLFLAQELQLDLERYERDLTSERLQQAFAEELAFARSLPIQGFPSMVLRMNSDYFAIDLDYRDFRPALQQVDALLQSANG